MKSIIIKISEQDYKRLKEYEKAPFNSLTSRIYEAIANGTLLPEDATNGDMIKALFPNGSQVKGACIYVMNDNKSNIFYDFDWWNASYKADKEK